MIFCNFSDIKRIKNYKLNFYNIFFQIFDKQFAKIKFLVFIFFLMSEKLQKVMIAKGQKYNICSLSAETEIQDLITGDNF